MTRAPFKKLKRDSRGITIVEFALVAPTLMVLLMAVFDLGYRVYVNSIFQGEMQKAARDLTLQTANASQNSIDSRVRNRVKVIMQNGTVTFTRKNVVSFSRAGQQEEFVDRIDPITNLPNGIRDPGECFQDENANGIWDSSGGQNGVGGANEIQIYTGTLSYPRIFPMYGLLGWSSTQTITATTILRNQPYGTTAARAAPTTVCT